MIKKEYIQPEAKEIKILLPTILAGSLTDETTGTSLNPDEETNTMDGLDLDFEEE